MKISASIYSYTKDQLSLGELVNELDEYGVEYFHIDCKDNPEVFYDIKNIKEISNTPIDFHLISSAPEDYFELVEELKIEKLTLQYEDLKHKPHIPENRSFELGLAITSDTDINVFDEYKDDCDFILFMTTTPGESGGVFNKENFKKIRQFRHKYPDKKIHVDGGINEKLSFILRNAGVYSAVIGSYLFKNNFIGSQLLKLKSDNIDSTYQVKDFMMEIDETPFIIHNQYSFLDILKSIEKYNIGFTNVVDENKNLVGLITNADIRKSLIKNFDKLPDINHQDIVNKNPIVCKENNTISELLSLIKKCKFPILFLPVVDENNILKGSIKFNNLIKGEL